MSEAVVQLALAERRNAMEGPLRFDALVTVHLPLASSSGDDDLVLVLGAYSSLDMVPSDGDGDEGGQKTPDVDGWVLRNWLVLGVTVIPGYSLRDTFVCYFHSVML